MTETTEQEQPATDAVLVPLDHIALDEGFQVRAKGTAPGVVKAYATAMRGGHQFPPITLVRVNDVLYCADGWHRAEACKFNAAQHGERPEIRATIQDAGTIEEAKWIAAQGNLRHGQPLKSREVREAFRRYVRAKQHRKGTRGLKSYREIAADLGGTKTHNTVRNWMEKEFPSVYLAMSDEGYSRNGGGLPLPDSGDGDLATLVLDHLKQVRNILPGITDKGLRGRLFAEANKLAAEMHRKQWPKAPPEDEPF